MVIFDQLFYLFLLLLLNNLKRTFYLIPKWKVMTLIWTINDQSMNLWKSHPRHSHKGCGNWRTANLSVRPCDGHPSSANMLNCGRTHEQGRYTIQKCICVSLQILPYRPSEQSFKTRTGMRTTMATVWGMNHITQQGVNIHKGIIYGSYKTCRDDLGSFQCGGLA